MHSQYCNEQVQNVGVELQGIRWNTVNGIVTQAMEGRREAVAALHDDSRQLFAT